MLYERDDAETRYRKALLNWQDKQEIPDGIEFEEYVGQDCHYDDSIDFKLSDLWPNKEYMDIELEEHELPKYTILELPSGRKKIMFHTDGKDPREIKPKVLGFTVPESDPDDWLGEVQRGDSVPYLSNLASTGNVDGIQTDDFKEWYDSEIRKRKFHKWKMMQAEDRGVKKWKCETVIKQRPKNQAIEMPKEWMDQWPSLREENNE